MRNDDKKSVSELHNDTMEQSQNEVVVGCLVASSVSLKDARLGIDPSIDFKPTKFVHSFPCATRNLS